MMSCHVMYLYIIWQVTNCCLCTRFLIWLRFICLVSTRNVNLPYMYLLSQMSLKSLLGVLSFLSNHLFQTFFHLRLVTYVICAVILDTWRKIGHMVRQVVFIILEIWSWKRIRFFSLPMTLSMLDSKKLSYMWLCVQQVLLLCYMCFYSVDHVLYGSHIFSCWTVMYAAVFHCQKCWVISVLK